MRSFRAGVFLLAGALLWASAFAADMTRVQALAAVEQTDAAVRLAGVDRLAEIGTTADGDQMLAQLGDADPRIREAAESAVWQIWSRSGDPEIDALFARGLVQLRLSALNDALATFDEIVKRRPAFAEGWNKRATIYFLLGQSDKSLADCDEVLKRNPRHFGALSGAGQIQMQLGRLRPALQFFRRAVEVHPNLEWPAQMIPILEQRLRDQDRNTT